MAGYTIHIPPGLSTEGVKRAAELGPEEVGSSDTPAGLARAAGFEVVLEEDATSQFEAVCAALIRAREALEVELRAVEGDEVFEDELRRKRHMLEGIREGLFCRSLLVARRVL